jgi:hypothetical protein
MLTDITEERRAREAMARQREAAHRTSRLVALGESASAIAHELNQPLAAIATYHNVCLRLLDAGETGSPERQEAMRKCRDQARRAGAIIQRLREVLRHPGVAHATQCDIDEQVTRMAEKYFPELCDSNSDPRAELLFDDGVAYMANCPAGSVDVVIVDSTDPVGPAEGLFNKAFYESCFRALKDDGILVQQSESPLALLDLIKEMRGEMGKAGFTAFKTLPFPQPCYPTGWWSVTMARKSGGFDFRQQDAANKGFDTLYYSAHLHTGALVAPPFVAKALGE